MKNFSKIIMFVLSISILNIGNAEQMVICTMQYDPVCGVDGNTYSNICVAINQKGVKVDYKGECKIKALPTNVVSKYDKYKPKIKTYIYNILDVKLKSYDNKKKVIIINKIIAKIDSALKLNKLSEKKTFVYSFTKEILKEYISDIR